jgi:hypothetical protein
MKEIPPVIDRRGLFFWWWWAFSVDPVETRSIASQPRKIPAIIHPKTPKKITFSPISPLPLKKYHFFREKISQSIALLIFLITFAAEF